MIGGEAWQKLVSWLPANDDPDRPQMTLATVTTSGAADARTVLLTEFDQQGLYFHTDSRSRKAADLAAHPEVALVILWPGFTRQLTVQGTAEVAAPGEIAAAFERRSAYLQQLAWQNTDEFAQVEGHERVSQWLAFGAEHTEGFAQPPTWTGYLVRPSRLTFWEGNPASASRRTEFTSPHWPATYLPG